MVGRCVRHTEGARPKRKGRKHAWVLFRRGLVYVGRQPQKIKVFPARHLLHLFSKSSFPPLRLVYPKGPAILEAGCTPDSDAPRLTKVRSWFERRKPDCYDILKQCAAPEKLRELHVDDNRHIWRFSLEGHKKISCLPFFLSGKTLIRFDRNLTNFGHDGLLLPEFPNLLHTVNTCCIMDHVSFACRACQHRPGAPGNNYLSFWVRSLAVRTADSDITAALQLFSCTSPRRIPAKAFQLPTRRNWLRRNQKTINTD